MQKGSTNANINSRTRPRITSTLNGVLEKYYFLRCAERGRKKCPYEELVVGVAHEPVDNQAVVTFSGVAVTDVQRRIHGKVVKIRCGRCGLVEDAEEFEFSRRRVGRQPAEGNEVATDAVSGEQFRWWRSCEQVSRNVGHAPQTKKR